MPHRVGMAFFICCTINDLPAQRPAMNHIILLKLIEDSALLMGPWWGWRAPAYSLAFRCSTSTILFAVLFSVVDPDEAW